MANFKGIQFDNQLVQASDDATNNAINRGVVSGIPNINNETSTLSWNYNPNNKVLYVYPSTMILQGRLIKVTSTLAYQLPLPGGQTYLGLNIDLTRTNTADTVVQIVGDNFVGGNTDTESLLTSNTAFIPVFTIASDNVYTYESTMPGDRILYTGLKYNFDSTSTPSPYYDYNIPGTRGRSYVAKIHVQSPNIPMGYTVLGGIILSAGMGVPGVRTAVINIPDFSGDRNNLAYTFRYLRIEVIPSYNRKNDIMNLKIRATQADTVNWSGKSTDGATRYQYGTFSVGIELIPYIGSKLM